MEATSIDLESGTAKFDLTILLTESSKGLRARFEYNTDVFEGGTIDRFATQFQLLLQEIIATPHKRLSQFSMLTPDERRQVLTEWNRTATEYERELCVHEVFEAQAQKSPTAVAVVFENQQLTYGELNRRATKVARRLIDLGVGPEAPVGICMERSPEMIVGMLAILKAGSAYLPLDRTYPNERIDFMLNDAKVRVLLTQRALIGQLPKSDALVVCVEEELAKEVIEKQNPIAKRSASDLAYIIYTSGSTGQPKGTTVPHRGVVRLVRNTNYVVISPEDVFLQLASISFDASTFEIWGALLNGAKLVLFPPHMPSLEELGRTIQQAKITALWLTAGLFHQMVDHQLEKLQGVRQLLAGGEALSVPHVRKALEKLGGCRIINGYGPTENTTFTCCYPIPADWQPGTSVPIGRPISNTEV